MQKDLNEIEKEKYKRFMTNTRSSDNIFIET